MAQSIENAGKAEPGHPGRKIAGRNILQMMGFVKNHPLTRRQNRGRSVIVGRSTQGEISQQQGVVNHQ